MASHSGGKKGRRIPSTLLQDMRWVYDHAEGETKEPARKRLQQLHKDDFNGFLTRLERMEKDHRGGRGEASGGPEGPPEPPKGLEPVEVELQKVLAECLAEVAAKKAARGQ